MKANWDGKMQISDEFRKIITLWFVNNETPFVTRLIDNIFMIR